MKVNVDAVEGGLLPEGEYVVRVADASDQISKKKPDGKGGNPMVVLDLVVADGPWEGAEVRDWIVPRFAQGAAKFTDLVLSTGLQVPKGDVEFEVADLVDRICRVTTYHDTYDDSEGRPRTSAKVSAYSELRPDDKVSPAAGNGKATDDKAIPF